MTCAVEHIHQVYWYTIFHMKALLSTRVLGAVIVGVALVAGTYVSTNFGATTVRPAAPTTAEQQVAAPIRSAIAVTDEDGNGIEDWRDEFITTEPIRLNSASTSPGAYIPPTTLTGRFGISFIQDAIRSESLGIGNRDEVINNAVDSLISETAVEIYDTPDILMTRDTSPTAIRDYANAVAGAILEYNQTDLDYELFILQDILNREDTERIEELREMAELYRLTRDAIVGIPVPQTMVKEHLDLINTLHAVHHDIKGMTLAFDDPAFALLRIQRYEDDVLGMLKALENMYVALEPYASEFSAADPAVFFVDFNPTSRIRI